MYLPIRIGDVIHAADIFGRCDDVLSARRWNSRLYSIAVNAVGGGDDVLPTRYPCCSGWSTWQFPRCCTSGARCMPFRLSTLLTELRAHLTEKVAAVSSPDRTSGEKWTKCRAL